MQQGGLRLVRGSTCVPDAARGAVVVMGNFDGVHKGHKALLAAARARAEKAGAALGVVTFEPHPRRYFKPDDAPFRLTSWQTKLRLFESLGVAVVYQLRFGAAMSQLPAARFVADVLHRDLGIRGIVVGEDFRFGRGRGGDGAALADLGGALGFDVELIGHAGDGTAYSSSRARGLLRAGDVGGAAAILGRPWEIEGRVVRGDQRGRTIGFATANVTLGDYLRPRFGVYAVRAGLGRGGDLVWRDGVANIGVRPTVDGTRELLEVHLLDWDGDLYGARVRVALVDFIRPEQTFDGLAALKAQIARDRDRAREMLKSPIMTGV